VLDSSVSNDNGRPADRVAHVTKGLFAKVQLLQQLVVLWQIMPLQVIEELATAGRHLQKPAARVEVLAVRAEMLGQVIDPGGEQRDLDFGRTGILLVSFVFCDDFGLNDCGGHGFVTRFHDCREPLQAPCRPPRRDRNRGLAGVTVPIRRDAGPVMVALRNRRTATDARAENPGSAGVAQAYFWPYSLGLFGWDQSIG
jgi:hypothetical protein